jgi:protein kinase-like protein
LGENSESCPVCALRGAVAYETESFSDVSSELRFDQYRVLQNEDGTPIELGRGTIGVTYKAFDVHLQCPVALKIINSRFVGDASARSRFVREARAAASVRHPNVASVFHLGESHGNYFYAIEFVEGETLGKYQVISDTSASICRNDHDPDSPEHVSQKSGWRGCLTRL